jgi:hypothetical protein
MQQTNGGSSSLDAIGNSQAPRPAPTAALEYPQRLRTREAESRCLNQRHVWIGNVRVLVFIGFVALCWNARKLGHPALYWLAGTVAVFFTLGGWDGRTVRARNRAQRAASFYRTGLARMEDRWKGSGEDGHDFQPPDHLYADDLDILGDGSLFQLLCVARTRMGKRCLASWLLAPANLEEVQKRQIAVSELASGLDLREDLAVEGESDQIQCDGQILEQWVQEESSLNYRRWWPWTLILAALSIPALVYGFWRGFWTPFLIVVLINASITFRGRHRLARMFAALDEAAKNLDALVCLLERVEHARFDSPENSALQAALLAGKLKASECIAKLDKLSQLADSRHNLFVRLLDVPLLYSVQLAFALQRWKDRFATGVPAWLDSIGQMEALASLAAYKFEHPDDPFPDFSEAEVPCFDGTALGHPLLPASSCVRNDVVIHGRGQILLVSGSNMSGKSTLLRVVGVNTVLAMAGAPVRASGLRLSPLALGSAINISDSLQRGVSHFYAEIKRIRRVVDLTAKGNVLFLFDEILQGTNSHDRHVGAEGIVRALIRNGAIGLVTTHDLALTALVATFPENIRNVHFQEKLESGKLQFDYRLREGVVTTSNGLELMKSIGLEV